MVRLSTCASNRNLKSTGCDLGILKVCNIKIWKMVCFFPHLITDEWNACTDQVYVDLSVITHFFILTENYQCR